MEIHAPEGPVLSGRHLLVQLATITMGVLIALSLEGLTGWFHHRALVREARANMLSEIADNKKDLDGVLLKQAESERDLKQALRFINDLLAVKKSDIHSVSLNLTSAQLASTSRSTAEATGALGYMEYSEVKRYAGVYEGQQLYMRVQERLLEAWIPMLNAVHDGDPEKLSEPDLQEWKRQILTSLSHLQAATSIGKSLSGEYANVIAASH